MAMIQDTTSSISTTSDIESVFPVENLLPLLNFGLKTLADLHGSREKNDLLVIGKARDLSQNSDFVESHLIKKSCGYGRRQKGGMMGDE